MKAFILSAGLGTRLRPLTDSLPKPLIPVQGKPLIAHILAQLKGLGIEQASINTHHLASVWADYQEILEQEGIELSYHYEPDLLDSGGGIANIAQELQQAGQLNEDAENDDVNKVDEDILIYNGDIWTDIDISQLITAHQNSDATVSLALRSEGEALRIHMPNAENQSISDIANPESNANLNEWYQFTGIYMAKASWLLSLPTGKYSVIPQWQELIGEQKLQGIVLDQGLWSDLGTLSAYNAVK